MKPEILVKYWPLALSVGTIFITLCMQWAIYGTRLNALELRQDRQGTSISSMQKQLTDLSSDFSGMKEKLNAIDSNVNYIRARIDNAIK